MQLPADAAHVEIWVTPGKGLGRAAQDAVSLRHTEGHTRVGLSQLQKLESFLTRAP